VVVKAVPAGRTVVGIPARLVGERAAALRELDPDNLIDLDHHLIPDPVGKAIGCLLDRIDAMEQELRALRGQTAPPESTCGTCAAGELCCEEHRHLRKEAS
jgi:serine O-acetyltransferase